MDQQKALKGNQLVEQLNELRRKENPDQFTIERIRREAETMRDIDPGGYYSIKGMIATLEKNPEEMRAGFEKALTASGQDPNILGNFATSLSNLGFYIEARNIRERLYPSLKSVPEFGLLLISNTFGTGQFSRALKLIDDWKKIQPDEKHYHEKDILQCAAFIETEGITEIELERLTAKVEEFLHERKFFDSSFFYWVATDEESSFLSGLIRLPIEIDELVELNLEWAEFFSCLQTEENFSDKVHYLFDSLEESTHADKYQPPVQTG